jgi:hypothetical protein
VADKDNIKVLFAVFLKEFFMRFLFFGRHLDMRGEVGEAAAD